MSESHKLFFGPYQIKKYYPILTPEDCKIFHQKKNKLGQVVNWEIKGRTKITGIRTYYQALNIILSL